jgi:HPt (histidine-containing phosphotransfer) domain-containing protein
MHAAHALKSGSGNVGATVLAGLCEEVESAADSGDLDAVASLLLRLQDEHRRVLRALDEQTLAAA